MEKKFEWFKLVISSRPAVCRDGICLHSITSIVYYRNLPTDDKLLQETFKVSRSFSSPKNSKQLIKSTCIFTPNVWGEGLCCTSVTHNSNNWTDWDQVAVLI